MLCRADSVGVFQVESRAQMATLPRLKPRTFYDLVVEVALIRPGPIQGGSVHPYIRRRNGQEPVTYLHPLLEPSLEKTLGVPLFQEQLMQMAIDVAGFTPGEADQLRQAMGSKRSRERMERLRDRLYDGMAERGITGEVADQIYDKLAAFANYGFPESHSVSFAYLVYASSWLKLYYPAAFCAALLNAQPMGFYSPHTLVQDARRHGVRGPHPRRQRVRGRRGARRVLLRRSGRGCGCPAAHVGARGTGGAARASRRCAGVGDDLAHADRRRPALRGHGGLLAPHRRHAAGDRGARHRRGVRVLRARAAGGAVGGGGGRAVAVRTGSPASSPGSTAPTLPGMSDRRRPIADLWATGVSPEGHPTRFVRERARRARRGDRPGLADGRGPARRCSWPAWSPIASARPPRRGTTFINLEDETGLINVICSKGCWPRYRRVAARGAGAADPGPAREGGGRDQRVAERIEPLPLAAPTKSRDFR